MRPNIGRRRLPYAHMPRQMRAVLGLFRLPLVVADVHNPRLMRAGLGYCRLPLADTASSIRTCHVRYVQALANSVCRWDDVACPMRVGIS